MVTWRPVLFLLSPIRAREAGAEASAMADRWRRFISSLAYRAREAGAAALWLMAERWSPFLFLLSPTRAREAGAAALWRLAARWSPAPTMVSELPGHRQPIAKFRRTDTGRLPSRAQRYGFERSAE